MNDGDVRAVLSSIEGTWAKLSPEKLRAWSDWLGRRDVTRAQCGAAIDFLIDQDTKFVSIPAFLAALRGVGAIQREMGVGDPVVVGGMKQRILDAAREASEREGVTINDRLRREQAATRDFLDDAIPSEDDEGIRYYRDRLTAYEELLAPREFAER